MRLKKIAIYALLPVLCGYLAASAHASRLAGDAKIPPMAVTTLAHILPRLAVPACAGETVTSAMNGLRHAVAASGLLRDTRPSREQEIQATVALWSPLESSTATPDREHPAEDAPVLLPGQD